MYTKIIYIANDGTEFEDEQECLDYEVEQEVLTAEMYDYNGRSTDKTSDACIVYLPDEDSAVHFIAKCEKDGTTAKGINDEDMGWFWWDEFNEEYLFLPEECIRSLGRAVDAHYAGTEQHK